MVLKIPFKLIQLGLSTVSTIPGRLEIIKLNANHTIINDTYNANIASMIAAIKVLENMPGHKIFVSGDMSELGNNNHLYHDMIGNFIYTSKINEVMSIGKLSINISKNSNKGEHYDSYNMLINNLIKKMSMYKILTVLIKGSRSAGLEKLVKKIIQDYNHDLTYY
ncbi:MAG: cyanophycin synthetase [Buchnera aphidicola (Schlechtendalia peitan)]